MQPGYEGKEDGTKGNRKQRDLTDCFKQLFAGKHLF